LYTGGPYPLAYLGLGDFFVLIFFGPLAVGGTYFLQTHVWSLESLLVGFAPGALSTAILIANNLRDADEDKKAGKLTLVVRFGRSFGKWEYTVLMLLAFSIPFFVASYHPFTLLACLGLFPAFKLIRKLFSCNDPQSFQAVFAKTPPLLFFFSLLFIIGWML
jgi:1,4-dihydroxy-2-naphthoate octaprenyltransferase